MALRYGPLGARTVHLCVDMQQVFALDTPWHTPWMKRVLPLVQSIAEFAPERTVFTRFVTPHTPGEMPGAWRRYYERWQDMTREKIAPGLLDLMPPLAALVPPAALVNKRLYSAFSAPDLQNLLEDRETDTLVVTGAETDVCVLASVLDAVDRGFRVVVAEDAICSSSDQTHDALMTLYRERFSEQIETAPAADILAVWRS
jgi:nicotinamidase-related amidase